MSAQLANMTATFLREECVTTHMDRFFAIVAMVTVEKMAAIAKVCFMYIIIIISVHFILNKALFCFPEV